MTTLTGPTLVLRPLAEADAAGIRAMVAMPMLARWWDPGDDPDWPMGADDDSVRFAVVEQATGSVVGLVQYGEETDPQYRHATIDILLDPHVHGRGLGTEAVGLLARHLFDEVGHHRITIDPAVANAAAIRCYEKVGFKRVGVLRRYERNHATGTWRDGLLLDLLPADLA